jgi:hypothetical protein
MPPGTATFHPNPFSTLKSTGALSSAATPEPFGPRKAGQSLLAIPVAKANAAIRDRAYSEANIRVGARSIYWHSIGSIPCSD